ncbi:leucyl/phenylalanyl-tRNA--protein transferase [Intrasporangium calvum]|uniref:Leucyl/phenylalanyl-tRNA--protein transferase n=1 Tax=Intrasporangium calvum TaxID=53358 RepID=A0ABT5GFP0_9MICO|nr:leucyl/phenylalanyl-tRNA--protein transferase [Intrasporangium calvum]MDC5696705.1 leucyl/phenylalanyl-tRNA--protein transferase [Intrasporangium calvum]
MPTPPPPTPWDFDLDRVPPGEDLIGVGADLDVATLYDAYTVGAFPMGIGDNGAEPIGWWSPDPRGILRMGDLKVSRSLRKSRSGFDVRVDTAFEQVILACADPRRTGRWITPRIVEAYVRLHDAGWAHSIETWRDGELVGGLYGVAVGGLFAGESMFHAARDASKVALVGLHEILAEDADPRRLIDVQWRTDHLATLGVTEVPRNEYRRLLADALEAPLPALWR